MNTKTTDIYRKIEIKENIKFYVPLKRICKQNNIKNFDQYIGLFFLRRFPGIVLNETNNESFEVGKKI